jgi:hypothetical protein
METASRKHPIVIVLASDCSRSRFKTAEKRPPLADARGSATGAATVRESVGFNQPLMHRERHRPRRPGLIQHHHPTSTASPLIVPNPPPVRSTTPGSSRAVPRGRRTTPPSRRAASSSRWTALVLESCLMVGPPPFCAIRTKPLTTTFRTKSSPQKICGRRTHSGRSAAAEPRA